MKNKNVQNIIKHFQITKEALKLHGLNDYFITDAWKRAGIDLSDKQLVISAARATRVFHPLTPSLKDIIVIHKGVKFTFAEYFHILDQLSDLHTSVFDVNGTLFYWEERYPEGLVSQKMAMTNAETREIGYYFFKSNDGQHGHTGIGIYGETYKGCDYPIEGYKVVKPKL